MSRTYPIEFEHSRIVKVVIPGKDDSELPIEISLDITKMDPGTTHRIEVTSDGQIHVHSDEPFIEVPPDVAPEDEDAYVAAMTEKHESIRAEFMEELRDTLEQG